MADHEEPIGQTVGEYRLLRWLGGGGFGHVYLAEPVRGGDQVAIKELQMRLTQHEDFRTFLNEARMIRLKHPHIMPLLDFGLGEDDTPFLVMEYAPKGTLRQRHPKGTRVPLATTVTYAAQMASALQYAHEAGQIHHDVKPENMLLRSDDALLLSDLGIATIAHSMRSVNAASSIGGTVPYMAPEQLNGMPLPQSDQYALAVVIYEWLAGRYPFQGTAAEIVMQHTTKAPPSLRNQVTDLPQGVEDVLFKALAKDPKDRFASMQDFAEALQQASQPQVNRTVIAPTRQVPPAPEQKITPIPTANLYPLTVTPPNTQPPSVHQSAVTLPATYTGAYSSPLPLPIQPISQALPNTAKTPLFAKPRILSKGRMQVLIATILGLIALIAGGSFAYPALQTYEANVHLMATVTAESNVYNEAVARNGIMFGFNAQHTRNNPYERLLSPANVSQLQQRWASPLDGPPLSTIPTAAKGLVYVGSVDDQLYAFDALTGQQKWAAPTGDSIETAPAVSNGFVYVGSADGKLYAFNALTGQQKWAAPYDKVNSYAFLAVSNGFVYVGSEDDKLYAFDATTGQQKWAVTTENTIDNSPAVANGLVYVNSYLGKLYAFDATTGQQRWVAPAGNIIDASSTVSNGLVYVGSTDHKLHAFDATTGQQKWVSPRIGHIGSSPAIANGIVYIGTDDGTLYAFSLAGVV